MEFLNRISNQEEPIELVQVLKLLAVMSAIEEFKPSMATKESVKVFIDILQRQYKSPEIRAEVGVIFTNLAVKGNPAATKTIQIPKILPYLVMIGNIKVGKTYSV